GSAQTRSTGTVRNAAARAAAAPALTAPASATAVASATHRGSREGERIQHPALGGEGGKVLHRVDEAERRRGVGGVEVAGDDAAGPTADAGGDRHVLLAVGAEV